MRQDIILVANEGQTIPSTLADKAIKEHPNAMGVAYVSKEDGLFAGAETAGIALKDFEEHQKDFIVLDRIYHFAKVAEGGMVKNEDLQPFVVLKTGEVKQVVAFIEGRFDVENDGQFTDGYVVAETILKDRFEEYWEICGQDIGKLSERMKGKAFAGEMERLCKPFKSSIVYLLSNGEVSIHSKSETKAEAPWGFTTSMLGLKEGIFPAAAAEAPKPVSALGTRVGALNKRVEAPAPAPSVSAGPAVTKVGETTVIHKQPEIPTQQTAAAVYIAPEMVWVIPRTDMKVHKLHDWYHKFNNGMVPANHQERPAIQMPKERALKLGSAKIVPKPGDTGKYQAFSEIPKEKVETAEPAKPVAAPVPLEIIPTYPVDEVKKVGELIQGSKQVMDPADWQKMENKYNTFWKAHGISAEDTFKWPLALREKIARLSPLQAAHAWQNSDYQRKLISEELLAQMEENEKLKKATVAAEPPPKRVLGAIRK